MRPFVIDGVAWSVSLSVCQSVCHDREPCKKRLNYCSTTVIFTKFTGFCFRDNLVRHTLYNLWTRPVTDSGEYIVCEILVKAAIPVRKFFGIIITPFIDTVSKIKTLDVGRSSGK